jgi:acyl-CoA thioesterase-1
MEKRLRTQYQGYNVVNASVSGETTSGGLQRLPHAVEVNRPQILVLELGANDALRGLPLSTAKDNLSKMVELAQKAGATVLLVGMRIPPNYGPKYTADFVQMYTDLSSSHHVPLVPFLLQSVALDSSRMQDDGLHPNALGEPAVLDTLWPQLVPLLKKDR